jgi:RNA polymerase-associated protein
MSPTASRSRSAMTLFSHTDCPLSHAVRLVMAVKGLPHELVWVDPASPPPDLAAAVPHAFVPTLMERDVVVYVARIIAEYLDERFPHPPLLPSDPLGRARGRLMAYRIETDWMAPLQSLRADSRQGHLRDALQASLAEAEPLFRMGRYFLSNDFGWADCLLLPVLWRLPAVGIERATLPPAIDAYAQRLFPTPLFQKTLSEAERTLAG